MNGTFENKSLITALKTPFGRDGSIDYSCLDYLVEVQIKAGVDGLVLGGTTGEGHLMSWDEQIPLIRHTVKRFGDSILIIGNVGSNYTKEATLGATKGFEAGMHAALQINPYYGKTSKEGLLAHFNQVLDIGPTILYNVPTRTCQDIGVEIIGNLKSHQNFVGVKECCGPERISILSQQGIACWSGNDDDCLTSIFECGAVGVISVMGNLLPSALRNYLTNKSTEMSAEHKELVTWLFSQPNPIPLNTAMAILGLCQPVFRMPYLPLSFEEREKGIAIFKRINFSDFKGYTLANLPDEGFTIF